MHTMARCASRRVAAAAAVVVAVALAVSSGVGATPETACRAAEEEDRRVDYGFCVSRLSHHHDSPDADTWGLAKVAADVGVCIAGDAAYDAKAMLASAGGGGGERAALERCAELYDRMGSAFAAAYDDINRRDYAAGKEKAGEAMSLARRCDGAFADAGLPSPLERQSSESVKIAVVCTAITSLVK